MLHPILSVLVKKPELVVDHVNGYASLVQEEVTAWATHGVERVIAWVAVAVSLIVFLILAGTALMLGAVTGIFHWALVGVPAAMLALSGLAYLKAASHEQQEAFTEFKAQLSADAQALRMMKAKS